MYKLQPTESLASGLKRVAEEQIAGAIQQLQCANDIYQARKHLKRARSVLRLLHSHLGPIYIEENRRLRDVARRFSALRDTDVSLELVVKFAEQYKRKSTLNPQRKALEAKQSELRQTQNSQAESIAELDHIRKRIEDWPLQNLTRPVIEVEIRKTHKQSRQALARAIKTRTIEDFHELRKSVKRELNQTRLLESETPLDQLKHLADILGDHHNLAILLTNLENPSRRFQSLVHRQLRQLETEIITTAPQIYIPKRKSPVEKYRQQASVG